MGVEKTYFQYLWYSAVGSRHTVAEIAAVAVVAVAAVAGVGGGVVLLDFVLFLVAIDGCCCCCCCC